MHHKTAIASLTMIAAAVLSRPIQGQTSEYFVMAGDQSTFHVLQGGTLIRSWSVLPDTEQYQYPIAVRDTVRTMGADQGDIGAEYDLFGNDLGPRYTHPVGPIRSWDGTTDGAFNYTIDTAGGIYRCGLDWSGCTLLFDTNGLGSLTYDPTNDSLWVSQFSSSTIVNYTMTGSVISSFGTGHSQNMALALDHADGTLWLHDRTTQGTFEQWSKAGLLLDRIAIAGMASENALGGEVALLSACPWDCEAAPNGVVGTADLLALLSDWGGTGPCDFDGGGVSTADLLKLLSNWGACP